jgi:hypothetical protein
MTFKLSELIDRPAPEPRQGCTGKEAFASPGAAQAAIRSLQKRDLHATEKGSRLRPYPCPHCRQFHVGHHPRGGKRQR